MKHINKTYSNLLFAYIGIFCFLLCTVNISAQVQLRDTTISWQHHRFELNDDYSMNSYTTVDDDIQQVEFTDVKVLENELIKLVIVPEYGGRVLSFLYKPTGHEYLYQSECGSAYGINAGNFYYNWLMVWGGIFPTFPEPEHGKTWVKPWAYDVVLNSADTVTIGMEYTDTTEYTNAPGSFNNGITGITCRVEVSIYSGSSAWDFDVKLINNNAVNVNYEYWTCTTLTPGSEPGNTGSPLNSEMVVPVTQYEAAWSPGNWIGNYGNLYSIDRINFLSEWTDMGIAYAHNLNSNYWGVINHDNVEGIFRISENIETPGMKFWTWGKNNVDNNMYDYSNGGADNYIELWAGVSNTFFTDAMLKSNEIKSWKETYSPTVNLNSINSINRTSAVNLLWQEDELLLSYELNAFRPSENYRINIEIQGNGNYSIADKQISALPLGNTEQFSLEGLGIIEGNYAVYFELKDMDENVLLSAEEDIYIPTSSTNSLSEELASNKMIIKSNMQDYLTIVMSNHGEYDLSIVALNGQIIAEYSFSGTTTHTKPLSPGIYIVQVRNNDSLYNQKVIVR